MGGAGAGATRPPESISSIIAESGGGGGKVQCHISSLTSYYNLMITRKFKGIV